MSKIVIVEDDVLVAKLYENKLRGQGHSVGVAHDAESGLELIKSTKPTFVLIDLMLPGRSGTELIRDIRRDPEFSSLPITAYSSADDDVMQQAVSAGSNWTISKTENSLKDIMLHLTDLLEATRNWSVYDSTNDFLGNKQNGAEEKGVELATALDRVLVVDDDPIIMEIVSDIVSKSGFQVVTADDGQKAHKILADDANFAVAILDVELPFLKGTDLVDYMRQEKRLMRIPVIMMTANESVRIQLDSMTSGAVIFVPKPFDRSVMETMLKVLTNKAIN